MSPGEAGPIPAGPVEKSGHPVAVTVPGGIDNPVGANPKKMPSPDQAMATDYQVEPMRSILPVLDEPNVDYVLASHTIVYDRSYPVRNGKINFDKGIT